MLLQSAKLWDRIPGLVAQARGDRWSTIHRAKRRSPATTSSRTWSARSSPAIALHSKRRPPAPGSLATSLEYSALHSLEKPRMVGKEARDDANKLLWLGILATDQSTSAKLPPLGGRDDGHDGRGDGHRRTLPGARARRCARARDSVRARAARRCSRAARMDATDPPMRPARSSTRRRGARSQSRGAIPMPISRRTIRIHRSTRRRRCSAPISPRRT